MPAGPNAASVAAVEDLSAYLEHRPDADDYAALAARVSELRNVGWPRLH